MSWFDTSIMAKRGVAAGKVTAEHNLCGGLAADFGMDEIEAYMLLTQCGRVRLGNMVDPKYTLGASIAKAILQGQG